MERLKFWLGFFAANLGVPAIFFITFRLEGAKPAITTAITAALMQVVYSVTKKIQLSPFFIVAAGFTVVFGVIDLVITSPRFFKLEPFFQNALIGSVFLGSLFTKTVIAEWFAAALPESVRPQLEGPKAPSMRAYLRKVTIAWIAYFYVKAGVYLWIAYQVDLGELVVWRTIIGGGSLLAMFAGEILYRKYKHAPEDALPFEAAEAPPPESSSLRRVRHLDDEGKPELREM